MTLFYNLSKKKIMPLIIFDHDTGRALKPKDGVPAEKNIPDQVNEWLAKNKNINILAANGMSYRTQVLDDTVDRTCERYYILYEEIKRE